MSKKEFGVEPEMIYSPRELSNIPEFVKEYGGINKPSGVQSKSLYVTILHAIKRARIPAMNYGLGQVPYYKIEGKDAITWLKELKEKREKIVNQ